MKSYGEYSMEDTEEFNESILKSPVVLFGLLLTFQRKVNSAKTAEDKIELLAKMTFISGQLNFNLVKGIEGRLDELDKRLKS